MRIGELSERSGASARSLRYYEEQGVLRSRRGRNGYRDYEAMAVNRVEMIKTLLGAGLPMDIVRDVLDCTAASSPNASACDIAPRMRMVRNRLRDQANQLQQQVDLLDRFLEMAEAAPARSA